jgi:hypothetical protein
MDQLSTPIVLFIFNRADTVRLVMERIAAVRPKTLFVVADGPRQHRPEDADRCRLARETVLQAIAWPCEVVRRFSDVNLGCDPNIVAGYNYVFSQVEDAISLEDDCVAEISFFRYCEEMLNCYRDCGQVMHVCGINPLDRWRSGDDSYFFSRECQFGCGFATWRRAWRFYDDAMTSWKLHRKRGTNRPPWFTNDVANFFNSYGDEIPENWDFKWAYAIMANSGLSIVPAANLIANVGFGPDATHCTTPKPPEPTYPIEFPLVQPSSIAVDRDYDIAFRKRFSRTLRRRIVRRLGWLVRRIKDAAPNKHRRRGD